MSYVLLVRIASMMKNLSQSNAMPLIQQLGQHLTKNSRPVVLMSRTRTKSERRYSAIKKEATAIIEVVRKWAHFLHARVFTLVTDQQSIAFMLDQRKRSKIKKPNTQQSF